MDSRTNMHPGDVLLYLEEQEEQARRDLEERLRIGEEMRRNRKRLWSGEIEQPHLFNNERRLNSRICSIMSVLGR